MMPGSPTLSPVPLGHIEPHAPLLTAPPDGQRLFKLMRAEHLIQAIKGGYLHFNRVDAYADFPTADRDDGAELPLDQPANQAAAFEKARHFTLSDYCTRSRGRTYACSFSLENSEYIWRHYGRGSPMGQVGLEFNFDKLRARLNQQLAGEAALMCGDLQCRQIFSINYGVVAYVDRSAHRINTDRTANPILYVYLKDARYDLERELRITLAAFGMGRFMLADGREIEFPPTLQLAFDYRRAFAEGAISQILLAPDADRAKLTEELCQLGIPPAS
jgi:hypothetical protein